ncbi:MAG: nuclear transport factor 2 family protein [Lysobacter sp.]|nr:nuclear transport factor 2 family protein [Lysobacter sp.]
MLSALLLVLAGTVFAAAPSRDERDLLREEAAVCHAVEAGDAAYVRKVLDPRFTLTSSTGVVTDLRQNLAEVAAREPRYSEFRNHDQRARLYGDAAIITGITSIRGTSAGQPIAADYQYTDTWIRRGRAWRLAASHASRLAH